jgi:hypothetical protein
VSRFRLATALILFVGIGTCKLMGADIVIDITADGQFIQKSPTEKPKQYSVVVTVGQTVRWHNAATEKHTATSDLRIKNEQGTANPLFDTKEINPNSDAADISFTTDMFTKACSALNVPPADGWVPIGYYCARHPDDMGGKIYFVSSNEMKEKLLKSSKGH